ncbi:MAG: hypothetical protein ACK5W9_03830 [Bdellovibrionales bacterium]
MGSNTMKIFFFFFLSVLVKAQPYFNHNISVQGFLKSGGSALNDVAGFPMKFVVKRNSTAVWCQSPVVPVPVVNGVFTSALTGNSNCDSLSNAFDASVLNFSSNSDVFSVDVTVDVLKNGFATSDDATFSGIQLASSPFAVRASVANRAEALTGTLPLSSGGTGATNAVNARANLGLGNVALLNLSGVGTDVLRGDGTFGTLPAVTLAGDVSGSASATTVDKIKGRNVSPTAPTNGQVLTWNNSTTQWEAQSLSPASLSNVSSANAPSTLVLRDSSGNFSAGVITADLSGNALTATTAVNVSGVVAIANGGTGATDAAAARLGLSAAASGVNTDITSIEGTARSSVVSLTPTTAGTTTAYTLTFTPSIGTLTSGQTVRFRVNATNTGAASLNVNGTGAVGMVSALTGAALQAGDLFLNSFVEATYNGTNWVVDLPPRMITATALNCGATVNANTFVVCPNVAAASVNAGDSVHCTPSADPSGTAGRIYWSAFATAGNISIRLGCNHTANCAITSRNWKCVVQK